MRELHLTPGGTGEDLTHSERRAARALVGESIRHELAERHAQHWPRYRPSARRILAARLVARRRSLLVVTDGEGASRRIVMTATYRATSARLGRLAVVPLWLTRLCSKGFVILATAMTLLALYHGQIGIGTLGAVAVLVALLTSPLVSTCRLRLGDRALAARARLFCPQHHDALAAGHGSPQPRTPEYGLRIERALRRRRDRAAVPRRDLPRAGGSLGLVVRHLRSSTPLREPRSGSRATRCLYRTMLLFPAGEPDGGSIERRDGCADLIPFKAPLSTRRTFEKV